VVEAAERASAHLVVGRAQLGRRIRELGTALGFLAPFLTLLIVFQYIPIFDLIVSSLFRYNLFTPDRREFVGLGNYARLINDSGFAGSMRVTISFLAAMLIIQVPLGLGLAVALNRARRGIGLLRAAFFAPVVASTVVTAAIWRLLLDPSNGLLNGVLGVFGLPPQGFITSQSEALPSIVMMQVWQQVGLTMVIFLGGLQFIPQDLYDAAAVDGTGPWQRFRYLTWPLLRRTTVVVAVITSITALQTFAPAFVLTQGGPNGSTSFLVYRIYRQAFSLLDPAYASAMSLALLALVVLISLLQMRVHRAEWTY
jgi:multiple sugar transport system permease protein